MSWVYTDDYIKRKEQQAIQDAAGLMTGAVMMANREKFEREYWIRRYAGQALQGFLASSTRFSGDASQLIALCIEASISSAIRLYENLEENLNVQK